MQVESENHHQAAPTLLASQGPQVNFVKFFGRWKVVTNEDHRHQSQRSETVGTGGLELEKRNRRQIEAVKQTEERDHPGPAPLIGGVAIPSDRCQQRVGKKTPERCRHAEQRRPAAVEHDVAAGACGAKRHARSKPSRIGEITGENHADGRAERTAANSVRRATTALAGGCLPFLFCRWPSRDSFLSFQQIFDVVFEPQQTLQARGCHSSRECALPCPPKQSAGCAESCRWCRLSVGSVATLR